MRTFKTSFVAVLLAVALCGRAGRAAEEPTGPEILQKCAAAYAALHSYVGMTATSSTITMLPAAGGPAAGAGTRANTLTQTASARIQFSRPGKFRVEGLDTGGLAFAIVSDGKKNWLSCAFKDHGAFVEQDSPETAISSMTGVAAGAPTTIPALLMKLNWGFPFNNTETATLAGHETVVGVDCYKIVQSSDTETQTFWVDSHTFLLRQTQSEQSQEQLAAMDRFIAANGGGVEAALPAIKSRSSMEFFVVQSVDAEPAAALFADPTR